MKRYHGGDKAKGGYYFNRERWEIVTIGKKIGILPGHRDARYMRIPVVLVFLLGPLMGGFYVITLPLVGIVLMLVFACKKLCLKARGMEAGVPDRTRAAENGDG